MSDRSGLLPEGLEELVFDKFKTLNTKPTPAGIADDEMAWCDGFMPLGPGNLRTLPDVGTPIYTASSNTVIWYWFGNIGQTPYCIVVLSDGSIVAVNTTTLSPISIAPPSTIGAFPLANINQIGATQWGNKYIILVAGQSNGFFIWDGTNFYKKGTLGPDVEIFQGGNGYTSQPTMNLIGGSGTGAAFVATEFNGIITGITVTNPGSGFQIGDNPIITFSGGGSSGVTAILNPVLTNGTVTSINIANGGAGYSTPTAIFLDQNGIGATVSLIASGGAITGFSIQNGGSGYSTKTQILVEDPNSPVAVATVDIMPTGVQGTCAGVYTSRLFIGDAALMQISAPGSLVDFAASDGGDIFTSNDPFLRANYVGIEQTNGFQYLIADSSVNYISGIQSSGSPLQTTFTNQNADPENGTAWQPTIGTFGNSIIFANQIGIQIGYGGNFEKISDALDGFYYTGNNSSANFIPSAAKAVIFGVKVWMLLFNVNVLAAPNQNKLLMTDGKRWWTSSQGINLKFVAGQEINSVLTAYGTDGNSIYPLFQRPSTAFSKTVQSKLFAEPGGYAVAKVIDRVWGAAQWNVPSGAIGLTVTVNTDVQSFVAPSVLLPAGLGGVTVFSPEPISSWGVLCGLTCTTTDADVTLISLTLGISENIARI